MRTQQEMYPLVAKRLETIEKEQGIRVLFAAEAGSRAAGTHWESSDFDVRFLYLRPREEYLRLDPLPDTLEYPLEEGWDLCGWDLRKALQQIHKGSPQLFEWLYSPVVYRDRDFSPAVCAADGAVVPAPVRCPALSGPAEDPHEVQSPGRSSGGKALALRGAVCPGRPVGH